MGTGLWHLAEGHHWTIIYKVKRLGKEGRKSEYAKRT